MTKTKTTTSTTSDFERYKEVSEKAAYLLQAIQKVWPTTPAYLIVTILLDVGIRLFKLAGFDEVEALKAIEEMVTEARAQHESLAQGTSTGAESGSAPDEG